VSIPIHTKETEIWDDIQYCYGRLPTLFKTHMVILLSIEFCYFAIILFFVTWKFRVRMDWVLIIIHCIISRENSVTTVFFMNSLIISSPNFIGSRNPRVDLIVIIYRIINNLLKKVIFRTINLISKSLIILRVKTVELGCWVTWKMEYHAGAHETTSVNTARQVSLARWFIILYYYNTFR